jgi:dipeptide/tripeptide permease
MFAGLMLYLFMKPKLLPGIGEPSRPSVSKPDLPALGHRTGGCGCLAVPSRILNSIDEFLTNAWVSRVIALAAVAWMVSFVLKQRPEDRGPVASIFIFTLFNALFWLGFEQASTSINLFTQRNTDRNFMGTEMATGFFQSVNPMFIVLFAPAFAGMWVWLGKRRMNPSQPVKSGWA